MQHVRSAGAFAPEKDGIAAHELERRVGEGSFGGQENEAARQPGGESLPGQVAGDIRLTQIVHAGTAKPCLAEEKSTGFYDVQGNREAGAQPNQRGRILRYVGFKEGETHGFSGSVVGRAQTRAKPEFSAASCRKTGKNRLLLYCSHTGRAGRSGRCRLFWRKTGCTRFPGPSFFPKAERQFYRGEKPVAHSQTADVTRRDFLYVATASAVAVGAAASVWPFIDQMNPSASVLALASVEVDIGAIQPGQSVTILWRGRPTFIRRRTPQEIEAARAVQLDDLIDPVARNANGLLDAPATDENRVVRPEWLV